MNSPVDIAQRFVFLRRSLNARLKNFHDTGKALEIQLKEINNDHFFIDEIGGGKGKLDLLVEETKTIMDWLDRTAGRTLAGDEEGV